MVGAPNPALFETVLPAAAGALIESISGWVAPETNINFFANPTSETFATAWPAATFERLAGIRLAHDPDRIFPYGPAHG